jgi:ABC-type lipoprotein release transport system permease subunit
MWQMCFRNLRRDTRRTVVTATAVALAVCAMVLFVEYVSFVERTLAEVVIYRQGNGHVQVYKRGALSGAATDPGRYAMRPDEAVRAREALRALDPAAIVTSQLEGVGLVQRNDRTSVFLATGVIPEEDRAIRRVGGERTGARVDDQVDGAALTSVARAQVLVTPQLAQVLTPLDGTPADGFVHLSAVAYDHRLNVVDADVVGAFTTAIEETENKSVKVPIGLLQELYRTDGVGRVVGVLADRGRTDAVAGHLRARLGGDFEVTTWKDPRVGKLYDSVMGFLTTVFTFTGIVLLAIAVLTIYNTVAISVLDRMTEIGTLRSLGFGRRPLALLLAREGLVLAVFGGIAGALLAGAASAGLAAAHLTTSLPRMSSPVPVRVAPSAEAVVAAVAIGALVAAVFSYRAGASRLGRPIIAYFQAPLAGVLLWAVGGLALPRMAAADPLAAPPPSHAVDPPPSAAELLQWLRAADVARGGYGSYAWDLSLTSHDASATTETQYRVDVKGNRALAFTTEPSASRGEQLLLQGRAMWFMKPGLRKPVSVSPRQRLSGQAANGDIASVQYAEWYTPSLSGETTIDGRRTFVLDLVAKNNDVTYDRITYYLDAQTHLAVRAEFLTKSGHPFKIAEMKYEQRAAAGGSAPFIASIRIVDATFPDQWSVLTYRNVSEVSHADGHFALSNLGQ